MSEEKVTNKSLLSWSGVIFLLVALLLVNAISKNLFRQVTFDLTEEGLYSLSEGTKNILGDLDTEVTLRLYFSKTDSVKFPALKLYGERVTNLLESYARAGAGNLSFESFDPRPDSDEELWAQKYGLRPISTPTGEKLFLGLVGLNSSGEEESIPFFDLGRQAFLEYDVTKLVYSLARPSKPKVGIISSLALETSAAQPQAVPDWMFVEQMKQVAEVEVLSKDTDSISENVSLLVVVHPKDLGEGTLYAIDQHVMRGGNLLVLVDPYCEADIPSTGEPAAMAGQYDRSSSLDVLLEKWGVKMLEGKAVGDIELATQVGTNRGGPPLNFILWLSLKQELFDRSDIVTSQIEDMLLPWAGALELSPVEGIRQIPLMKTSERASLIDRSKFQFGGGRPEDLVRDYMPGAKAQTLAVRLQGKFESNFPTGKPGGEEPVMSSAEGRHLRQAIKDSNVIVVSDVDFLANRFSVSAQNFFGNPIVTLRNGNLIFLLNAVENLLGSSDLIGIRSRGVFSRPFTKVQELERRAEQRWRQEENVFQAKLNQANQQLRQFQQEGAGGEDQLFNQQVVTKVKELREQRRVAQMKLREVRRNLRLEKEQLGDLLFLANTFLVPLILIVLAVVSQRVKIMRRAERKHE